MKMKKWSSQWKQFMQLREEAWKKKIQDFNGVWTRDLAITGAMLYQLSYEATDIGSRSVVGSYVPVKEMTVNDIIISYVIDSHFIVLKGFRNDWQIIICLSKCLVDTKGRRVMGEVRKKKYPADWFWRGKSFQGKTWEK